MSKRHADERKDLERVMSDRGANPISLSYEVLSSITNDFSEDRVIGKGGFGVVYQGVLQDWKVAVKKLTVRNDYGHEQFRAEVDSLMRVKTHKNIVRFVGYCLHTKNSAMKLEGKFQFVEQSTKLLCFEFAPNGDLRRYLDKEQPNKDVWHKPYHLTKEICEGLKNLHDNDMCHMDLKPENILLDADMIPKITDFGMSKSMDDGRTTLISENIGGTMVYMPPESKFGKEISRRSDIYALGIIMMELFTGLKFFDVDNVGIHPAFSAAASWGHHGVMNHVTFVRSFIKMGSKSLGDYGEQAQRCIEIAQTCSHQEKYKRPTIQEIIEKLNVIQGTSIYEMMSTTKATEDSELLDVYPPRHVPFFFRPNQLNSSPLRLTNKTDAAVAFRLLPDHEGYIKPSDIRGVLPPRSTRTYLLWIEKQPPVELVITLESCKALDYVHINDVDDNFSPEDPDRNELHAVVLTMRDQAAGETSQEQPTPLGILTKVICRADDPEYITAIDVHPTEPWILASHYDGRVTIWDYITQERVMDLKIPDSSGLRTAAFVARKQWLMAGDWSGKIHVREYNTKEEVKKWDAHKSCVMSLAIHPSKPFLLSASDEGLIHLWDWTNWERKRTFPAHSGYVEKVMFNPMDSNFFASVGTDSTLKIWKTVIARCVQSVDCQQENQLSADYFQPPGADRQFMITGSSSGKARIWDLKTYTCIRMIEGLQTGHGCNVGVVHDYPPDRQLLVTALKDNAVSLYNFNTKGCDNMIDFKLGKVRTFAYVEAIKSVAIGFEGGIGIMEIN